MKQSITRFLTAAAEATGGAVAAEATGGAVAAEATGGAVAAEATGGAVAEVEAVAAVAAVEAKTLEQLTAELTAVRTAIKSANTDDEMDTATLKMLKIKSAIKALEAKADYEAKLAKVAELRNEEVASIDELINAAREHAVAKKDDKQVSADKLTALREAFINKALAKFIAPKEVEVAGDGTGKAVSNKTSKIRESVNAWFTEGKTGAEVRKLVRDTYGNYNSVVLAYEKEHATA
jgi:hypothetical protein